MATLIIEDINTGSNILRGSAGSFTGVTTSITWFDLSNPQGIYPFRYKGGGTMRFSASIEGTFSATCQIVVSLQDSTPASTPCGASALAVPILGSSMTAPTLVSINQDIRWIGVNCSAFVSGTGTLWVYGVLPS